MIPRIYQPISLENETQITLDFWGIQHIKALRLHKNDTIVIFNGGNINYYAEILNISAKEVRVKILSEEKSSTEPSLTFHLFQAISRSERMDYTIQKTTELGVTSITPIISERCEVRLPPERWEKRHQHWQQIAISASEQTGRTQIPIISFPRSLSKALEETPDSLALVLDPEGTHILTDLDAYFNKKPKSISLLIGPEGGLTSTEIELAKQKTFKALRLGSRILRTETAGATVLAAMHARWGDFVL